MSQSDVFESFVRFASRDLTGRPLKTTYAGYDFCLSSLSTTVALACNVFGFDSPEYEYLSLFLSSFEGRAFVGPVLPA